MLQIGRRNEAEPIAWVLINIASVVNGIGPLQLEARQELNLDLEYLASLHFNVAIPLSMSFWGCLRILVLCQGQAIYQNPDVDLIDDWHGRARVIVEIGGSRLKGRTLVEVRFNSRIRLQKRPEH